MSGGWKPEAFPSVSAYLMVDGAQRVIDFLKGAFGATEGRRFDLPDGRIMHAEVHIDDSILMLSDGGGAYPPFPAWLHVYVRDVDATYGQALAVGGVSVQEPQVKPGDPDRRAGVQDPAGNIWWISTQVA